MYCVERTLFVHDIFIIQDFLCVEIIIMDPHFIFVFRFNIYQLKLITIKVFRYVFFLNIEILKFKIFYSITCMKNIFDNFKFSARLLIDLMAFK